MQEDNLKPTVSETDGVNKEEIKMNKVDMMAQSTSVSVLSKMKESDKAAALYTYKVTPNFYESCVDEEQH